jgi:hypothetical protein
MFTDDKNVKGVNVVFKNGESLQLTGADAEAIITWANSNATDFITVTE